jgi:hypothetical protein
MEPVRLSESRARCPKCLAYVVGAETPLLPNPTCSFCGSLLPVSEFVCDSDFVSFPSIFENERPKTLVLIDGSLLAISNGFLSASLDALTAMRELWNVAVLSVTSAVQFLLPGNKLAVVSDLFDAILPPNAFLPNLPESLDLLRCYHLPTKSGPLIVPVVHMAAKSIGRDGKITNGITLGDSPFYWDQWLLTQILRD